MYNNFENYDDFWDNYYSKSLRRWEFVFPDKETFINGMSNFFNNFIYETDNLNTILDQIYTRLNAKHRGQLFRYINLYRIMEKLNEQIVTPLVNIYIQLISFNNMNNELNGSTFKSITKSFGADNTELDETQKQYFEGSSQNEDYDASKSLYFIKQRTTFLNSANKIYQKSGKLFMLYTDQKIETGAINYEQ